MKFKRQFNHFLVVLSVGLFFSALAEYLYSKELLPISFIQLTIIFFACSIFLLLLEKRNIKNILGRPLFLWIAGLFIYTIFWGGYAIAIDGSHSEKAMDQVSTYLLACVFLFSFSIILYRKSAYELSQKLLIVIVVLSVALNIIDIINLDTNLFCPYIAQAGGLYAEPNNCSNALCFGYVLTIQRVSDKYKFPYSLWVFIGILLTQSRGGFIIFSLIIFVFLLKGEFNKKSILMTSMVLVILVSTIGTKLYTNKISTFSNITENYQKLNRIKNLISSDIGTLKEDPRTKILTYYLNLWTEKPMLGHGVGAALANEQADDGYIFHKVSSHNQVVNMMVDSGMIGLLLYITLIFSFMFYNGRLVYSFHSILFIAVFIGFSMLLHTMLTFYYAFFSYAFIARYVQNEYENDKFNSSLLNYTNQHYGKN